MSFSEVITYNSADPFSFDLTKVQFSAGTVHLLNVPPYTVVPQLVTSQHQNTITSLTSFASVQGGGAGTSVNFQLVLNSLPYWWSAVLAKWTSADGTSATANSAAVINAHAGDLFTDLILITPQFLGLNIWLATSNNANTPTLTSTTIGYDWLNSVSTPMSNCLITGYLADLAGSIPLPTTAHPVQLLVSCDRGFFHGNNFIEPFTKTFNFSTTTGYVSASIIETATPGVKLKFAITYYDGSSLRTSQFFNAVVPNQPEVSLNNLSSIVPYDFG